MGKALYRKYRSKSLDEIVGQSHITDMLQRAIAKGSISHAYLLTGPRGVGKTSIARILAHEINGLPYADDTTHLDIIEIDAASNNGIEDIRDLRDRVLIAPSSAKKKIYIIDEVHMLSKPAFNALLKTLEEPPEHVVFILATTDADKLPATIISRVQRFNFRTIHPADATAHLRMIADTEGITIDDDALALIALHGNGSFRDSISLLDQLQNVSDGAITLPLIEQVLGLASSDLLQELLAAYQANDLQRIMQLIDDSEQRGTPAVVLAGQLVRHIRTQVLDHPELLPLLDNLLEISKSAWPDIKLITALGARTSSTATAKPTVALEAAHITIPKIVEAPRPLAVAAATSVPATATKPSRKKGPANSAIAPTIPKDKPSGFAWQAFCDAVRDAAPGAGSLLTNAGFSLVASHLTVYAGKKFTKTQLDKSLPVLIDCLNQQGIDGEITVVAELAPASNSQTAAVLDIMGGGQEVSM